MKIYNLMPIFTSRNIKSLIAKAHAALGSTIGEVVMPLTVPAIREFNRPFTGALSGLNAPQFTASRGDICLAKQGFVNAHHYDGEVQHATVLVPVYSSSDKLYKGMIKVNLACRGKNTVQDCPVVQVDPKVWAKAEYVDHTGSDGDLGGKTYWVSCLDPVDEDPHFNPFDYAQAVLPKRIKLEGTGDYLITASLCAFLSEVFRHLEPCDRALFLEILGQKGRLTKFLQYAASTRSHHHTDHGLLVHTAETVAHVLLTAIENSELESPKLEKPSPDSSQQKLEADNPPFDLSLTLLAALLHDLAKVGDYYRLAPNVYSTNMNCELLGHEQTMLKWIAVACAVSGFYPSERELALEHAICAVRKQHDQAGARKRKTPESFVLHKADCASARAFDLGQPSVLLTQHFVCGE